MSKSISFIHAADLHLDSPFKGLSHIPDQVLKEIRQSTFKALDNLVNIAITKNVDFVLLVGDLFDNDKQSLKAQVYLKKAFEELKEHDISVYLSYGNHDYQSGNIHPVNYPENVFIFPSEEVSSFIYTKGEKSATIYGFSYENRAVMKNKATEYNRCNNDTDFHIATLHGTLHGNQAHDPYAPFTLTDLQREHFDYWALGHIHKREQLSERPPIIYPGNIQGRHRNEFGDKGCYYVTLSENHAESVFIPTQEIIFENIIVDLSECGTLDEMMSMLEISIGQTTSKRLIHLTFISEYKNILSFENEGLFEEVMEVMNDKLGDSQFWMFIYAYKVKYNDTIQVDYGDFFIGELINTLENLPLEDTIEDLFSHRQAKHYIDKSAIESIRKQAKDQLLLHLNHSGSGEGN